MAELMRERKLLRDVLPKDREARTEFNEKPFYSEVGDFLLLFLSGEDAYADRVDNVLTVFRSKATDEIVGCKIKSVSILARNVVNIFRVDDDEVQLSIVLLNAAGPDLDHQHHYYDLGAKMGTIKIPAAILRSSLARAADACSAA